MKRFLKRFMEPETDRDCMLGVVVMVLVTIGLAQLTLKLLPNSMLGEGIKSLLYLEGVLSVGVYVLLYFMIHEPKHKNLRAGEKPTIPP